MGWKRFFSLAAMVLIIFSTVPDFGGKAEARGMYCTRHRAECQRRKEEADKNAAYYDRLFQERRAKLTPEQRAKEDAEDAAAMAKWKTDFEAESERLRQETLAAHNQQMYILAALFGLFFVFAAGIVVAVFSIE